MQATLFSNACIDCLNRVLQLREHLGGHRRDIRHATLDFQNPRVDLATSANDFDLREVRRERMSIYFKMPPNKLKEGSVLVNLFSISSSTSTPACCRRRTRP